MRETKIPPELREAIFHQVEASLPDLNPEKCYTLKKICGKAFWNQLSDGERRLGGRCMAQLVAHSRFPLCFVDRKHEYPKYYQLKWATH